ncbi:MAG TPA: hypothetical protein VLY63_25415 [Anaerolineae bacterium]|nr:hypothetical protein [Anaerolineae bacterium]
MALQRRTLLLALGLISEFVYLVASCRLPWWRYGGRLTSWPQILGEGRVSLGLCVAGIGLLMVAYLCGWSIVRMGGDLRAMVWGFAGVFSATLFLLMPITSDLFTTLSRAHLFTDLGGNPLLEAPLRSTDPLVQAYPSYYATRPSVYGPAWALLSALGTIGRHDVVGGLFYLKGVAVTAYLGSTWLLERILLRIRPHAATEGLFLFAWNPLVLLMAVGDGHNDIVMMALVLLSAWLLLRRQWALSIGALALSVWIKYISLIFVPLVAIYLWQQLSHQRGSKRWAPLVTGGLLAGLLSVLVFWPFGNLETALCIPERLLWPVNWRTHTTELMAWGIGLGVLFFLPVYAVIAWRVMGSGGSFQRMGNALFVASVLAFLLGWARSQPWHLLWPAALVGLSDRRWAWPVVAGLSGALLLAQTWVEWGMPGISSIS